MKCVTCLPNSTDTILIVRKIPWKRACAHKCYMDAWATLTAVCSCNIELQWQLHSHQFLGEAHSYLFFKKPLPASWNRQIHSILQNTLHLLSPSETMACLRLLCPLPKWKKSQVESHPIFHGQETFSPSLAHTDLPSLPYVWVWDDMGWYLVFPDFCLQWVWLVS